MDHIFSRSDRQNLLPQREKTVEPLPSVRQQRNAARGRFEQAPRRAISVGCHDPPRNIQRCAARAEKRRMIRWRHMRQQGYIRGPALVGILRSTNQKFFRWHSLRRLQKKFRQSLLPVLRVGSQIRERRTKLVARQYRQVVLRIDRAIERRHPSRTETTLQLIESAPSRIT